MTRNKNLQRAIDAAGGMRALARAIDVHYQAIQAWNTIPAKWIIKIEHATGVPREELRPDLYLAPRPKHMKG